MIGRVVRSQDFERALASPAWLRSAHFSLHHAVDVATVTAHEDGKGELSTGQADITTPPVDDLTGRGVSTGLATRLGLVVPKRHARRSVTRNLLKRQMRAAAERHAEHLAPGAWVLRLRSPFARSDFPSAASEALRQAVRRELDEMLGRLVPRRRGAGRA